MHTVSHFSYTPLIKCKITCKRKVIFLFWDYQRKAHLYLHQLLKFNWYQIRNEWENGSRRALPSKHHFTLHYFEWNSDLIALFSGSNFCYAGDKSRFILGNIYDWNVFVNFIIFLTFYFLGSQLAKVWKKLVLLLFLKLVKISYDSE